MLMQVVYILLNSLKYAIINMKRKKLLKKTEQKLAFI